MATSLLKQWKRAGFSTADVQGMWYAGQLLKGNLGPQMSAVLKRYGLQSLTRWAYDSIVQGKSQEQILLELYDQPQFKKRFPAIFKRESANLPAISVEDYLNYEEVASSLGSTWGIPLSKTEVDNLLSNDVSPSELEQRFNIAATAVYQSSAETRNELQRLFGISSGQLAKYWMDPKKELPNLQNKYRMGEIAGAALRTTYGQITEPEAERLLQAGFDERASMEGFSTLASIRSLFTPLNQGESIISRQTQMDFLTGDIEAVKAVERRARQRTAQFSGAGAFQPGRMGFTTGTAES